MIGKFDERFIIQEGTEEIDAGGTTTTWSDQGTHWGASVDADSKVQERYQSLDSEVTEIIKLNGDPTLNYADYRLKRVSDGKIFEPTAPPITKGEFSKVTFVGVKHGE